MYAHSVLLSDYSVFDVWFEWSEESNRIISQSMHIVYIYTIYITVSMEYLLEIIWKLFTNLRLKICQKQFDQDIIIVTETHLYV